MLPACRFCVRYLKFLGIVLWLSGEVGAAPKPKDNPTRNHPLHQKQFYADILTLVSKTTFCAGEEFTIDYATNTVFGFGNSFIAQLSDASGSFGSPIAIGSLTESRSGTMKVRIPVDMSAGSHYRIRTVAITPQLTGTANDVDLAILSAPNVSVSVSGPTIFCSGQSVTITASSKEKNLVWSNGATTPSITVSESGDYAVTVTNANDCPRTSAAIHVLVEQVLQPFTITSNKPPSICEGNRVELGVPRIEGVVYQWQRNGQNVGVSANALGVVEPGEYTVRMSNGCSSMTAHMEVSLQAKVDPPIAAAITQCGPGSVTLKASGGIEGKYRWYNANGDPIPGALRSEFTTPSLSKSTFFYVANELFGCESSKVRISVTIHPEPKISAGPDLAIEEGETVQLQGSGGRVYQWTSSAQHTILQTAAPVVKPASTTTYILTATDDNGCLSSDDMTIVVRKKLSVPNAFTPNNDGVNDTWEIANIESRQDVKLEVFNRWGNKVYESSGYPQPWDGVADGKELPMNTYFYVISLEGGRQRLTGSVSIIR